MLRSLAGDLRVAIRALRAAPVVTLATIVTLVLGIGATTAAFSIANGLILRPLPVQDPQRLVTISSDSALRYGFQAGGGWSYAMWDRLRQRADAFDGAFAWTLQTLDLSDGSQRRPATVLIASGDFFRTLGVRAAAGRTFTPADDVRGGGPEGAVAVISYDFSRRLSDGAAGAIGSHVTVEGVPLTVIGVTPRHFYGVDVGQPFDIAIPFGVEPMIQARRSLLDTDRALLLTVMLRLRDGQTIPQATAILHAMQPRIVGPSAPQILYEPFTLVPASRGISDRSQLRQRYTQPLAVLAILSGILLLMVCVNLGHLLLGRAMARRQDLSVRLALGAPRWRLARHLLVEALVPGVVGGLLALFFATWTSRALVAGLPAAGRSVLIALPVDWRVLIFAASVTIVVIALVAAGPALHAARVPPAAALQDEGRAPGARGSGILAAALVAQVALSIVLLAAAGLFVRSLSRIASVPLGFDPDGLLVMSVNAARSAAAPGSSMQHDRILEAIRAAPGVTHAAGSVWTPLGTGGGLLMDARGRRTDLRRVAFNFVSPGWFETYETPLRTGRDFDARDHARAPRVAIINESLRQMLPPESARPGAAIEAGPCDDGCTVIGIVADAMYGRSLRDRPPPTVYLPLAQSGGLTPPDAPLRVSVRTAGDHPELVPGLQAALSQVDTGLTFAVRPIARDVGDALAQDRLVASLAGFFGAVGLLLAAVGVYGVASYAVTRRRGEIAIRVALGGPPGKVVRTMLARLSWCVLAGSAAGVLAALWLSRFVASLLFGLAPGDPVSLAASVITFTLVATVAAWLPARRAARTDPVRVLREH